MTAPNAAVGVLPGWRGTDPDGGTWVLTADRDSAPWTYVNTSGGSDGHRYRTQGEAEAAGLVPLIPAPDSMGLSIDLGETWGVWGCNTLVEALTALGVEPGMDLGDVLLLAGSSAAPLAAPALLDPGNPEHLRQVVSLIDALPLPGLHNHALLAVTRSLRDEADRLDRERAEAEQDAADRERAEEYANGFEDATPDDRRGLRQGYLAGIRAARDEKAGA